MVIKGWVLEVLMAVLIALIAAMLFFQAKTRSALRESCQEELQLHGKLVTVVCMRYVGK